MAEDFFLKIEGVEGECEVKGFEGQIQPSSWHWGAVNIATDTSGSGLGSGRPEVQEFSFSVANGKASPLALLALLKGTHLGEAKLTCRKTTGEATPETFLEITFNDCVVSSYNVSGAGALPQESLSFRFAKVTFNQYAQATQGGALTRGTPVVYDVKLSEAK